MIVTVRLFARAKDLAGTNILHIELPEGAIVATLRQGLATQQPALAELLKRSAIAVGGDFAVDAAVLHAEDDVVVLPPVSGG
jgi:molybdopterin converting factor small subunit